MLEQHLIVTTQPHAANENIVLWNDIRVTVLAEGLFRLEQDQDRLFCDQATQSIWFRNAAPISFSADLQEKKLVIRTAKATLTVLSDLKKSTVEIDGSTVVIGKVKNLPGAYRSLDNCNGDTYDNEGEIYKIKLEDGIVSACGVGVYDDTDALILAEDGKLYARCDDDADLYVFAHGKDYRGALRDLFSISGKVPLVPKYAFGNWWSRYHAYTETEYLHILDELAERDVPLTIATIDMDWHWSTTLDERKQISASGKNDDFHGGADGWTGYSWNTDLFPDYKRFLKKIKDRNLNITLNLHPAVGVRYFEDMYREMAEVMGVDPASEQVIPFDFTSDDFINAYFKLLHKPYERDGVEFWWIDWQQGTTTAMSGLDPLWALNHYHTLDHASDHVPLILSRYCRIGSHRYPLGFSGDTHITWKSLAYIPYFTAMGTNAGYTWWSHDIGGHTKGIKDDELYARYVQFGVFSPINRLHCSSSMIMTKEPKVYMNGMGLIAEDFLRLRHRMIPFLYSASYETNERGQALIEPMYYAYPDEKDAYRAPGQYLFGGHLIVAPIAQKSDRNGMVCKKVWLPDGRWTDIFTGDEYIGGAWVDMVRWTDTIPVLAAQGCIFPLDGRRHTNSIDNPDLLEVMVFNGDGSYTLHEDRDGMLAHTEFFSHASADEQVLEITTEGNYAALPAKRTYRLQFRNIARGSVRVFADGEPISFELDDAGAYLQITLSDAMPRIKYTVCVSYKDDYFAYRSGRIVYSLIRMEGDNAERDKLRHDLKYSDQEAGRRIIDEHPGLSVNQRKRLKEAW